MSLFHVRALLTAIFAGAMLLAVLGWIFVGWLRSKFGSKPPQDSN